MKGLPYFRWYPADAETDSAYAAMTWAERGFYHWCLNYAWINDGLSENLEQMAKAAKVSRREFCKLWDVVGKCFINQGSRYRNPRQEEERSHARTKSERATESVRTRYERRYERSTTDATNVLPRAPASESESESESENSSSSGNGNSAPTQKPTTAAAALPPLQLQHEYPETLRVIHAHDMSADPILCLRMANRIAQMVSGAPHLESWPPGWAERSVTDQTIAEACREVYAKVPNCGTGLLLSKVPTLLVNYGEQGAKNEKSVRK